MLLIVDKTGTQTTCPRPLSRKKLRQLCPHAHAGLTSRQLFMKFGRTSFMLRRELKRQAEDRARLQSAQANVRVAAAAAASAPESKGVVSRFFGNLKRKFDRAVALGKGAK